MRLLATVVAVALAGCGDPKPPPTAWEPPAVTGTLDLAFAVDVATPTTDLARDALRSGLTAYIHEGLPDFAWDKAARELRLGWVLFDPIWQIITPSLDQTDLSARMTLLDPYVTRVLAHNGKVLFAFEAIPRWLSPQPNNETLIGPNLKTWYSLPPKDWGAWQQLTQSFATHFNNDLGGGANVGYMIGSEPDNYWLGSEDELHLYYQYAVAGLHAANASAPVGGITPSHHSEATFNLTHEQASAPLLDGWLAFCQSQALPVDFVTWHSYPAGSPAPAATTQWGRGAREVGGWARASGYPNARLLVTDWPDWRARSENDTVYRSSWVASGLIAMAKDRLFSPTHLLRDVPVDEALSAIDGSYGGGDGLMTKVGAIKPSYNVYRMLAATEGNLVTVDTGDPFVSALATVDAATGDVYLVVSYFVPEDWHVIQNDMVAGFDATAADAELAASGMTKDQLEALAAGAVDGSVDIEALSFSENVKAFLRAARALKLAADARRTLATHTTITVRGLRDGTWQRELQIVGRDHSNPHAYRKQLQQAVAPYLEASDEAGAFAQVQAFDERSDVALEAPVVDNVTAVGGSASVTLDVSPYDVMLVVLRPR